MKKRLERLEDFARDAEKGVKCLFIEFEGNPEQLYGNADFSGWNLGKHVKDETFQVVCCYLKEEFIAQSEGGTAQ